MVGVSIAVHALAYGHADGDTTRKGAMSKGALLLRLRAVRCAQPARLCLACQGWEQVWDGYIYIYDALDLLT